MCGLERCILHCFQLRQRPLILLLHNCSVVILQSFCKRPGQQGCFVKLEMLWGVLLVVVLFWSLDNGNKLPRAFACRRPTDQGM
jgi:hypothetical protein